MRGMSKNLKHLFYYEFKKLIIRPAGIIISCVVTFFYLLYFGNLCSYYSLYDRESYEYYMDVLDEYDNYSEAFVALSNIYNYLLVADIKDGLDKTGISDDLREELLSDIEKNYPFSFQDIPQEVISIGSDADQRNEHVNVLRDVIDQYEKNQSFADDIDDMITNSYLVDEVLGDDRNISRQIILSRSAYEKCKYIVPEIGMWQGLAILSDDKYFIYSVILITLLWCVNVFGIDKENGVAESIGSTGYGRGKIQIVKFWTSFTITAIIYTLTYLLRLILAYKRCGISDLSRAIQSVYIYRYSPFNITIADYLVIDYIFKLLFVIFLSLIFSLINIFGKNNSIAISVAGAILLVEFLAFRYIDDNSILTPIRCINLFYIFCTREFFSGLRFVNLFGYSLRIVYVLQIFLIVSIVTMYTVIRNTSSSDFFLHKSRWYGFGSNVKLIQTTNMVLCELKMLFCTCLGFLFMIPIFAVSYMVWMSPSESLSESEYYYQQYVLEVNSLSIDEAHNYIIGELESLDGEFMTASSDVLVERLNNKKEALLMLDEQVNELDGIDDGLGNIKVVSNVSLAGIFESNYEKALVLLITLVLCSAPVSILVGMERNSGIMALVDSTVNGGRRYYGVRFAAIACYISICLASIYTGYFHVWNSVYQMRDWSASIQCTTYFRYSMVDISIGCLCILIALLLYCVMILFAQLPCFFAQYFKNSEVIWGMTTLIYFLLFFLVHISGLC